MFESSKNSLKIYLAGRLSVDDWRFKILNQDQFPNLGSGDKWPVLRQAIFGVHDYTGPFFTKREIDEWCFLDRIHLWCYDKSEACPARTNCSNHLLCGDCNIYEFDQLQPTLVTRLRIKDCCFDAIDRSDAVFAWLNSKEAYGTLIEIGYAVAKGKMVWVASDDAKIENDLWFAAVSADTYYFNFPRDQPNDALEAILKSLNYETKPSLCESPIEQAFWDKAKEKINNLT